ncbi:MAG: NUDIX domain-containing protein [Alphaproteobacteria bacterium]|nr:NUDIX domain-containing protein [Alphaproteobacteria bacterium]
MTREYPDRPIAAVGAVVVENGLVLLIRRGKPPRQGQWSLPGGAQELGESYAEAVHREILEETGLNVEILGLIDVVDSISRDESGRVRFHYVLADVAARPVGGAIKAGSDVSEARWFTPEQIFALPLWSETIRIIRIGLEMAGGAATR